MRVCMVWWMMKGKMKGFCWRGQRLRRKVTIGWKLQCCTRMQRSLFLGKKMVEEAAGAYKTKTIEILVKRLEKLIF